MGIIHDNPQDQHESSPPPQLNKQPEATTPNPTPNPTPAVGFTTPSRSPDPKKRKSNNGAATKTTPNHHQPQKQSAHNTEPHQTEKDNGIDNPPTIEANISSPLTTSNDELKAMLLATNQAMAQLTTNVSNNFDTAFKTMTTNNTNITGQIETVNKNLHSQIATQNVKLTKLERKLLDNTKRTQSQLEDYSKQLSAVFEYLDMTAEEMQSQASRNAKKNNKVTSRSSKTLRSAHETSDRDENMGAET